MKNRKWLIAGILILAELTLCGAIVGLSWLGIAQAQAGNVSWRFFSVDATSAEADEEQRLAVDGPATLSIENPNGNIVITGGEGDEIVIQAHKTAWGPNQAEAEAALARLKLNISQNGNQVTVRVEQPSKAIGSSQLSSMFGSSATLTRHLKVLRDAGLVEVRRDAQRRLYRLRVEPLRELDHWLEPYRAELAERLDSLERHLERTARAILPKERSH